MKERYSKTLNCIKKNIPLYVLTLAFALIYGVRMFINNPWYDELYTYYSFISRGPLYAAIHWPLPNNHMGYSALSGFLNYFGNPTIALRGVSYICAVINIPLIYTLTGRILPHSSFSSAFITQIGYRSASSLTPSADGKIQPSSGPDNGNNAPALPGIITACVYISNYLVHNMAVQGRGYTLSTTLYLIAILAFLDIIEGKRRYITFAFCCAFGLYVVPTSTFWVIPLCIIGIVHLLAKREYKTLFKFFICDVCAAAGALLMYAAVWLAIGSNLLIKSPSSGYSGMSHLQVIKNAPFAAIKEGLDYMLASPYIQSMDRATVIKQIFEYLLRLYGYFYKNLGIPVLLFLALTAGFAFAGAFSKRRALFDTYLCISIIMLPLMFMIQSVQPYLRVSSFFGSVIALGVTYMLLRLLFIIGKDKVREFIFGPGIMSKIVLPLIPVIAVIALVLTPHYRMPIADRENDIKEILDMYLQDHDHIPSICYTDDYQKYVIKFYYDEEPAEVAAFDADMILVSDNLENDPSDTPIIWPMLVNGDTLDLEKIKEEYVETIKTDKYTVYVKSNVAY